MPDEKPYVAPPPAWVRDQEIVAQRVTFDKRSDTVRKRGSPGEPDGSGFWHSMGDYHPDDLAPWLSRDEQEMILAALEHGRDDTLCDEGHCPITPALSLLKERLQHVPGSQGDG